MVLSRKKHRYFRLRLDHGFTIVEIMVCLVVIGTLAAICVPSLGSTMANSRDKQRSSRVTLLSETLEKYYRQNGEYPTCESLQQPIDVVTTTILKGLDPNALTAPGAQQGTNSITCSVASTNTFSYIVSADGAYTLTYNQEQDNKAVTLNSRYNGGTLLGSTTLTANIIDVNQIDLSWTAVTDASYYKVQRTVDSTFKTGINEVTTHDLNLTNTGLSSGVKYYFRIMAKAVNANSNWVVADATTPILAPSSPTVSTSTAGASTTYSWATPTCSAGSARYQYRYTINNGYDSGLVQNATPSVAFTTANEGYTFTVAVQSQCYTADTSSPWSSAGSASYTRPITAPSGPVVSVAYSSPNIMATITPITCGTGATAEYGIRSRTNDGIWGSYSAWSTSTTYTQAATQGVKYGYQAQAHCHTAVADSSTTIGSEGTYVYPISTVPSAPTVNSSTAGSSTTYSWSSVSCSYGSVSYQYRYTTNYGYDSGYVSIASSPVSFTTSNEGYTFTVAVQAHCSTSYSTSSWSSAGSASYTRPYTLSVSAGTGGSVSSGGSYLPGSSPTITAYPNSGYVFSSWSGSTSCSGSSSHTIYMDGTKSCVANFVVSNYTLTLAVSGLGSYTNCASENGTCSVGSITNVRYGAYSSWYYKNSVSGSIACTNSNFGGDPLPNYVKSCQYQAAVNASGGGTYSSGSSVTINASPSGDFVSWSGSTGCSGSASHSITLDSNKTCTASFSNKVVDSPTPPPTPSTPSVSAIISGSNAIGTISPVSCSVGSPEYQMRFWRTKTGSDGSWTGWTAWSTTTSMTQTALQGNMHTFEAVAH